jgi:hypothetical protein
LHLRLGCSLPQNSSPLSLSLLLPLPAPFLRLARAPRTSKGSPLLSSRPGSLSRSSGSLRMRLEVTSHLFSPKRHLLAASSWSHSLVSLTIATCSSWCFLLLCLPVHTNLLMALCRMTADTSHSLQLQGFANGDLTFQPIKFTGKCVYFFFCGCRFHLTSYPLTFQYSKLFYRLLYLWHNF